MFNQYNTSIKVWQPRKANELFRAEFYSEKENIKAKSESKTIKECLEKGFKKLEYLYRLKKQYQEISNRPTTNLGSL